MFGSFNGMDHLCFGLGSLSDKYAKIFFKDKRDIENNLYRQKLKPMIINCKLFSPYQ